MTTIISERSGIQVFPERARVVLRVLYEAYEKRKMLFAYTVRSDAPQTRFRPEILEVGSLAHLLWLFFAAMTDRRDLSDNVYAGHGRLRRSRPQYYEEVVRGDLSQQEEIMGQLQKERISMPRASSVNWVKCSETLFTTFAGNPMNLYEGRTIDEIVDMKNKKGNQIPGFGPKILSLLALFYQELGMTIPRDAFPIDVHGQRFALSTGIVTVRSTVRNEQLEKILRPLFSTIAREEGWPMMEIAHAIWFLGNRRCTKCSLNSLASYDCPVFDQCGGAVSSALYFQKALWNLEATRYPRSGERQFGLPTDAPLFRAGDG